jgi:DNA-binding MarR family transcriptional regulator
MSGKLAKEIRKSGPFSSVQQEAHLNLLRTTDALMRGFEALFKPHNLSGTQYNVLRILRGHGAEGCACKMIGEELITRDPDITRLLDRLETRGLITRQRSGEDRRVVTAKITQAGIDLLAALDAPVEELHRIQLGHMSERELASLVDLLEKARKAGE